MNVSMNDFSITSTELSQPLGKIFLEEERGFRVVDCNSLNCSAQPLQQGNCPEDIASNVEKCFRVFGKYCAGLLSGIALWQCIIIYQLSPPHFDMADFITHYSFLSQALQVIFHLLCTICMVAALDRFYVGDLKLSLFKQVLCYKSRIIVALLYSLSLIFSLSIANIDDIFGYYQHKSLAWNVSEIQLLKDELEYWKSMNTARAFTVILGWTAIVVQQDV